MIDFNDVPNDSGKEFELIPAGTVARAVLTMKRGETVIPDYSSQPMFKVGATGAKYLECEFTIVGGPYDKRKFWQNIMCDGGKINPEKVWKQKLYGWVKNNAPDSITKYM